MTEGVQVGVRGGTGRPWIFDLGRLEFECWLGH